MATTLWFCMTSCADHVSDVDRYRHVQSSILTGVIGNVGSLLLPIVGGIHGISVPISRGDPPDY